MTEEYLLLSCRHCNTQNRVLKSKVLKNTDKTICGQCRKPIFYTKNEPFNDISSQSYEHPLDRSALNALKKVPGTGTVLKMILKESVERYYRILFMQNFVKVTPTHMYHIHDLLRHACMILDIKKIPELFVYQDPHPNAFTAGVDSPYIGISTSIVDLLSEEELLGVIAHELGHIQCGHVLYKTAASLIVQILLKLFGGMLGGLSNLAILAIIQAFLYWDRCSELSSDRAELLVTKSFDIHVHTTMKLASGSQKLLEHLDMDEFLKQAEEAKNLKEENFFNNIFIAMQGSMTTHPFPVWRVGHLQEWVNTGNYLEILQGRYIMNSQEDKGFHEEDFKKSENETSIIDSFKKLLGIG